LPFAWFDGYTYVHWKEAAEIHTNNYVSINHVCQNLTKIDMASKLLVDSSMSEFMMICLALLELLRASRRMGGGQSEFNNYFTIIQIFDKFDTVMLVAVVVVVVVVMALVVVVVMVVVVVVMVVVVVVFNSALSESDNSAFTISSESKRMQTLMKFA
jgi:hypothetical protein